jgi:hypothetical protein
VCRAFLLTGEANVQKKQLDGIHPNEVGYEELCEIRDAAALPEFTLTPAHSKALDAQLARHTAARVAAGLSVVAFETSVGGEANKQETV